MNEQFEIIVVNSATTDELSVEVWDGDYLVFELLRESDVTHIKLGPWSTDPRSSSPLADRTYTLDVFGGLLREATERMSALYPESRPG